MCMFGVMQNYEIQLSTRNNKQQNVREKGRSVFTGPAIYNLQNHS